jgi:SAM-dependent methyltransferase
MADKNLLDQWKKDEQAPFEGWDFSYLDGRLTDEDPLWDYLALAKELAGQATSLLDMDTGGGENLSKLASFPKEAYAIEGWHPNVAVAAKKLEPFGVKVIEANSIERLPFEDEKFDLILNRHGAYTVLELHRVLKPGGQFFSQQVGGDNLADLSEYFGDKAKWPFNTLKTRAPEFEKQGFELKRTEDWTGKAVFHDVGAIVYFLKAIPWIVEGFSVDTHLEYLEKLQAQLESGTPLQFTYTRHLIHAVKK